MTDPLPIDAPAELAVDVRPAAAEDVPFIRATWREGHRQSPGMDRSPMWQYKQTRGAIIDRLLSHHETHLLAAYVPSDDSRWPERVAGWIAWTPGRVPALHWLYVRAGENGYRERGMAALLFEQSGIGSRLVYTFVGAQRPEKMRRIHNAEGKLVGRKYTGRPYSELLVEAGMRRGVASAHVDIGEWMEAMA